MMTREPSIAIVRCQAALDVCSLLYVLEVHLVERLAGSLGFVLVEYSIECHAHLRCTFLLRANNPEGYILVRIFGSLARWHLYQWIPVITFFESGNKHARVRKYAALDWW